MKKRDIENREDITRLMATFYRALLKDDEFKFIFEKVAKVDMLEHMDIIVDFWDSVLFQSGKYKRNTLEVHLDLHFKHRLKEAHFNHWLKVFNDTVNDLFEGEIAKGAKERALSVGTIIKMKINQLDQRRLEIQN